uniref:Transcription factor Elf N-terminal domain-containing protein n=1 Tax=Nothobranchius furzeri TaxID=105023 RepID=A0A8C6MD68_NOTFU
METICCFCVFNGIYFSCLQQLSEEEEQEVVQQDVEAVIIEEVEEEEEEEEEGVILQEEDCPAVIVEEVSSAQVEECYSAQVLVYDDGTYLMQDVAEEQEVVTEVAETGELHLTGCCILGDDKTKRSFSFLEKENLVLGTAVCSSNVSVAQHRGPGGQVRSYRPSVIVS